VWRYLLMPIAALPQVELPTIQVSADLPGASAEVMATSVAAPLERQLALISNVTELSSTSAQGSTSITIQFDLSRNIDAAAQDVQAAINAAAGLLPKSLPNPPTYEKANPADFQIMSLAVTSKTLPLAQLNIYADTYIAQRLSRIKRRRTDRFARRESPRCGFRSTRTSSRRCSSAGAGPFRAGSGNRERAEGNIDGARRS